MREACEGQAVRLGAKPLAHAFTLAQGVGGAQHRQPVARRPCGHTRSVTPTRTRPKN
ncbi:MAG: hypothetical protein NZ455_11380 [Bacteroidia bacterium]|nr:hypothetical protein [Bacteroidia bacterium]